MVDVASSYFVGLGTPTSRDTGEAGSKVSMGIFPGHSRLGP